MTISSDRLAWVGRTCTRNGKRYFNPTMSGFSFIMKGTNAACTLSSNPELWPEDYRCVLGVYVTELPENTSLRSEIKDGYFWHDFPAEPQKRITLEEQSGRYTLFESASEKTVIIRVLKLTETPFGQAGFENLEITGELLSSGSVDTENGSSSITAAFASGCPKIEFIGDSITCGYGVDAPDENCHFSSRTERPDKAYAFLAAKELKAEYSFISFSGIGFVSQYVPENVDIPLTETLMQALWPYEDRKLDEYLERAPELYRPDGWEPDLAVINIGTNDDSWCRGKPEREAVYTSSYRHFLELLNSRYPSAQILCSLGIMGQRLFGALEKAANLFNRDFHSETAKVQTLLFPEQTPIEDGYGADYHPSEASHRKAAQCLIERLRVFFPEL